MAEELNTQEDFSFYRKLVKYIIYGLSAAFAFWIFISITIQVFWPEKAPAVETDPSPEK
ncbi:MAG: hypothetical protein JXR95_05800 [Deltaproteobacteria bacterium]|nr:hypothetical protein [Deltaproteobacteria bacterium]